MKILARTALLLVAFPFSVQAQLPPEIDPASYAADLKTILDRSPQLSQPGSPLPIVPPREGWALGMVSWIAADRTGLVYLLHRGDKADPIVVLDQKGKVIRSWGAGLFQTAHSIRLDPQGNVWTTDAKSSVVTKFAPDGRRLLEIKVGGVPVNCDTAFCGTTDIAFGPDGRLFVADGYRNARIIEYRADGTRVRAWGTAGTRPGEFRLPHSIVADEQGMIYVADRENGRIQRFDLDGKYLGEWLRYGKTFGLALGADGAIWLASQYPHEPNMSPGWLIKVERRTGRALGYVPATAAHGIHCTPSGDVLISPGPAGKPHVFRASRAPVDEPRMKLPPRFEEVRCS